VYIRRVEPTSPASSVLREGDILLSFEDTDIANDGTVPFRSGERISFSYLISQKYTDEEVLVPAPLSCTFGVIEMHLGKYWQCGCGSS
jgi:hypothetical protein